MPDHLNKPVLVAGAGPMAQAHIAALKKLGCNITIVGRGNESAGKCEEITGLKVTCGGIKKYLKDNPGVCENFDSAIIATPFDSLTPTALMLAKSGIKRILLEKPGGMNVKDIEDLVEAAEAYKTEIYVAYNRRFYSSVSEAVKMIKDDGGVTSFHFEFTEWSHKIEELNTPDSFKAEWFLANSTHVIDLAFFLGGKPESLCSFSGGALSWHDRSVFSGCGKTEKGALFSYNANWAAPGRWGVEIMTAKRRYIFRPLEELHIQEKGSIQISKADINAADDSDFKPGILKQAKAFLDGEMSDFLTINDQLNRMELYKKIRYGTES